MDTLKVSIAIQEKDDDSLDSHDVESDDHEKELVG